MKQKPHFIAYGIIVMFIIFLVLISSVFHTLNLTIRPQEAISLNDGWQKKTSQGEWESIPSLSTNIELNEDLPFTVRVLLSEDFEYGQKILLRTSLASITVKVSESIIYEVDFEEVGHYASSWHIVEIPENSANEYLEITLYTPYTSMRGIVNEVYYGDNASLYFMIFSQFGLRFLVGMMTLFVGVVIFISSAIIFRKSNTYTIYLGAFSIIFSFWIMAESRMLQLITSNSFLLASVSYISLSLLILPLAVYIKNVVIKRHVHKVIYDIISITALVNTVMIIILQLTGLVDFFESVIVTIFILILTIFISIGILAKEVVDYRNKHAQTALLMMSLIAFFTVLETIIFAISDFRRTSDFAIMGLGIIMVIVFFYFVRFVMTTYKDSLEKKLYEKLAYTDSLTGSLNRFAFFKDLQVLNNELEENQSIRIIFFDLDNLKAINDTYGHDAGDQAIKRLFKLIDEVFYENSSCYRLGGDEFIVIAHELSDGVYEKLVKQFYEEVSKLNQHTPYTFSVSVGSSLYDPFKDENLNHTLKRSDTKMYEIKNLKKNRQ